MPSTKQKDFAEKAHGTFVQTSVKCIDVGKSKSAQLVINVLGRIGNSETSWVCRAIFFTDKLWHYKSYVVRKDAVGDKIARKSYELLLLNIKSAVNVVKMLHYEESVMYTWFILNNYSVSQAYWVIILSVINQYF